MKSRCQHFGSCGGCQLQHISYEEQLEKKKNYLRSLYAKDITVIGSEQEFNYRNRMDFIVTTNGLSLRKQGDYTKTIPIKECHLIPKEIHKTFIDFQEKLRKFSAYDQNTKEGLVRYVVFRYAPTTKQLMVILTTTTHDDDFESFVASIDATSVYWYTYGGSSDISLPRGKPHRQYKQTYITDTICDVSLRYGPQSFFQSNTAVATSLFSKLQSYVSGVVADVCCGVGTISCIVASKATQVIGIDTVNEAITYAKENASTAQATNTEFFCADMGDLATHVKHIDTLIVDPPRTGLDAKTLKTIAFLKPKTIIYVSCNPTTHIRDSAFFSDYDCVLLEGYDMFPQTEHLEVLSVFERRS